MKFSGPWVLPGTWGQQKRGLGDTSGHPQEKSGNGEPRHKTPVSGLASTETSGQTATPCRPWRARARRSPGHAQLCHCGSRPWFLLVFWERDTGQGHSAFHWDRSPRLSLSRSTSASARLWFSKRRGHKEDRVSATGVSEQSVGPLEKEEKNLQKGTPGMAEQQKASSRHGSRPRCCPLNGWVSPCHRLMAGSKNMGANLSVPFCYQARWPTIHLPLQTNTSGTSALGWELEGRKEKHPPTCSSTLPSPNTAPNRRGAIGKES